MKRTLSESIFFLAEYLYIPENWWLDDTIWIGLQIAHLVYDYSKEHNAWRRLY